MRQNPENLLFFFFQKQKKKKKREEKKQKRRRRRKRREELEMHVSFFAASAFKYLTGFLTNFCVD